MAMPTVSILLPTFNGERHLARQLDSILNQTWRDFELIVIDDGSTDGTPIVLEEYARRDPRFELLSASGNRGQKARLSELVGRATGQWIAISDQDDIWAPNKIERLLAAIGPAAIAFGRSELIDEDSTSLDRTLLNVISAPWRSSDKLSLLFRPQISAHAMMGKREIFTPDVFNSAQPFDWLLSIVGQFGDGVVYDDDAVVFHRMHRFNSHNTNVLVRANLSLLRWHHARDLITLAKRRRLGLIEACRRLAASGFVSDDKRRRFREVEQLCTSAWTMPRQKPSAGELRTSILAILRPMAGSEQDWQTVFDRLTLLTHGLFHPQSLNRLKRVL